MYKNFNITESEKEQILNRLKENGYGQPINEQGPPKDKTPPPGPKLPIDPKLNVAQNIQKLERLMRRRLTPLEINKLTFDLDNLKRVPKRTTTPTVDKNDLTGDNKGEGVNLYGNEAQTVLQYSATIDKIVKSGTGVDIFVSGDYEFADRYFHWEPNAPYFQAFVKSTRKPLSWESNGKMRYQKLYNKQFSGVIQNMTTPVTSTNDSMWDFTSPMNEQSDKIGTVNDQFGTIKQIIGKPVVFFTDKEGKIPYGNKMTILKVMKDPTYSDKFRIYFKELGNEFFTFECSMKAFYMMGKNVFVYNTQLLHALSLALCNSELSNDGKLKSVPNVKYVKNDTQGLPNQTDSQTLSETKQKPLNEGQEILKDIFKSLIK
jgi:hypothetical protein